MTAKEAKGFIDAAEAQGFMHQGSRGEAYGEVIMNQVIIPFVYG